MSTSAYGKQSRCARSTAIELRKITLSCRLPHESMHTPDNEYEQDLIADATATTFEAEALAESWRLLVLVLFWAPWCGHCRLLMPLLRDTVYAASGEIKLVKVNADEHPNLAAQFDTVSIPKVIAFINGAPVDSFVGSKSTEAIESFIHNIGHPSG
jgi:thioredoxin